MAGQESGSQRPSAAWLARLVSMKRMPATPSSTVVRARLSGGGASPAARAWMELLHSAGAKDLIRSYGYAVK